MKVIENTDKTFISNTSAGNVCELHGNEAVYHLLSDDLYSDKIKAVVRELCCNAYDSHVEANKEHVPFKVTIPTAFHHFFEVEDEGIGMDDETVKKVFGGYFNSTKRNTNKQTGMYGLGSKTPFIFNDTFNIRVRYNGRELQYAAYKENGIPHISNALSDIPTTECNGVKISVPVSPNHKHDFEKAIKSVLQWFPVMPEIMNGPEVASKVLENIEPHGIKENTMSIVNVSEDSDVFVLMGNVTYPLSYRHITSELSDIVFWKRHSATIILHVPIGSVDVTPSRETLSYNERTVKYLTEEVPAMVEKWREDLLLPVADKSNFEKAIYLSNISSSSFYENARRIIDNDALTIKVNDCFKDKTGKAEFDKQRIVFAHKSYKKALDVFPYDEIDTTALNDIDIETLGQRLGDNKINRNTVVDFINNTRIVVMSVSRDSKNPKLIGRVKTTKEVALENAITTDSNVICVFVPFEINDKDKSNFIVECHFKLGITSERIKFTTLDGERDTVKPNIVKTAPAVKNGDIKGRCHVGNFTHSTNITDLIEEHGGESNVIKFYTDKGVVSTSRTQNNFLQIFSDIEIPFEMMKALHRDKYVIVAMRNKINIKSIDESQGWYCIDDVLDTITESEINEVIRGIIYKTYIRLSIHEPNTVANELLQVSYEPLCEIQTKFEEIYREYISENEVADVNTLLGCMSPACEDILEACIKQKHGIEEGMSPAIDKLIKFANSLQHLEYMADDIVKSINCKYRGIDRMIYSYNSWTPEQQKNNSELVKLTLLSLIEHDKI